MNGEAWELETMHEQGDITIREAREDEADLLTELALQSKAYWGYPDEFMHACLQELTVSAQNIRDGCAVVAELADQLVAFYQLEPCGTRELELDALFVAPGHIGHGIGRRMIEHAVQSAREDGARRLVIQGDPHAAAFYVRAGAVQVGERESGSFPGRWLPVFEIELEATSGTGK